MTLFCSSSVRVAEVAVFGCLLAAGLVGAACARAAVPTTVLVAPGGYSPAVSGDGRFVAYAGDGVYVRDMVAGVTDRIDLSPSGAPANDEVYGSVDISRDGRYVMFGSWASNLVPNDNNDFADVFLRDRKLGTTTIIPHLYPLGDWVMSANGRYFATAAGTDDGKDGSLLWYDRIENRVRRGLVGSDAAEVIDISDNGRSVLVWGDVKGGRVWKPLTGRLIRFNQAVGGGYVSKYAVGGNALSADGTHVLFTSESNRLVPHDSNGTDDAFVRNLVTHRTHRISISTRRRQANGSSQGLGISASGRYSLFASRATNLVRGDTNGKIDIFVRDNRTKTTTRCSVSATGAQANRGSDPYDAAISPDGLYVAFLSAATNLVDGDTNGSVDLFERGPTC